MIELIKSDVFDRWLRGLRDTQARAKISVRLNRGPIVVVLLCGGDKSSQPSDIEQAKAIAKQWKE
ncbi:hypothetical protein LG277_03450 [Vreelandella aquamarina]